MASPVPSHLQIMELSSHLSSSFLPTCSALSKTAGMSVPVWWVTRFFLCHRRDCDQSAPDIRKSLELCGSRCRVNVKPRDTSTLLRRIVGSRSTVALVCLIASSKTHQKLALYKHVVSSHEHNNTSAQAVASLPKAGRCAAKDGQTSTIVKARNRCNFTGQTFRTNLDSRFYTVSAFWARSAIGK